MAKGLDDPIGMVHGRADREIRLGYLSLCAQRL
jgi:hypothetical protein